MPLARGLSRKAIEHRAYFTSDDESLDFNLLSDKDSDFEVPPATFSSSEDSDNENTKVDQSKRKKKNISPSFTLI